MLIIVGLAKKEELPELCETDDVHPKIFDKVAPIEALWDKIKVKESPASRARTPEPSVAEREVAKPVFRTPPSSGRLGPRSSTMRSELQIPKWSEGFNSEFDSTNCSEVSLLIIAAEGVRVANK